MRTVAEVRLWGGTVGAVTLEEGEKIAAFEYDPGFVARGLSISPLLMPPSAGVFRFPDLSTKTYYGLPGLLADSLPDKFGMALIDTWLASQGRKPESFNAVERLCYTGAQGMGALEFVPATRPDNGRTGSIRIDHLVDLASKILLHRKKSSAPLPGIDGMPAFKDLLAVGTLAGGARAKAIITWNPLTQEIRSGQAQDQEGFEHWLMKLDGVRGNRDKEVDDPRGFGAVELAYFRMAVDVGITMSDCRLLEEKGRRHFMTRRFDRLPGGKKIHMQSLCALAHYDISRAGIYSYEQVFQVIRKLGLPVGTIEQQFRRMVFNIITRNHDDHAKNIAFLMDEEGRWSLAPAFDITYSYNPTGAWTSCHQMTMNGKRDGFALKDFKACALAAAMREARAEAIVREVIKIVAQWPDYAEEVGVSKPLRELIGKNLRLL
jgi:serine/threonine-protein kinase HipA